MHGRKLTAVLIFIVFSILYIWTMCPTIYTMDNGELIVAAYKMQIAHPTGYPLFCLLGKLSTIVIPFGSIAWRINAMNAVISAAVIMMLFIALSEISKRRVAVFTAALFGVSPIFWEIATSAEAHALTGLFISTELWLFLKWRKCRDNRLLYWLAFVAGLSLTNHMTAALVLPAIFIGILMVDKTVILNWRFMTRATLLCILPLSLYAYLPIRAEASIGSIWGDIYRSSGFIDHVTGKAFRSRMFSLPASMVWSNFLAFLKFTVGQFPLYLIWAIPIGAILIKKQKRGLLAALGFIIIINVVYSVNYAIPDIDQYYLPTFLVLSIFTAMGIDYVVRRIKPQNVKTIASISLLVIPVIAGYAYLPRAYKHDATFIMDYTDNVLATVEKNALLIGCGDATYNAMLYQRVVDGKRPDLIVIERSILHGWMPGDTVWTARYYYDNVSAPSPAMRRFCWPNNYSKRDTISEKLLYDIIEATVKERPVYMVCTGEGKYRHPIIGKLEKNFELLPEGVTYRIWPKSEAAKIDLIALAKYNEKLWSSYNMPRIDDGTIQGGVLEREIPGRYAAFRVSLGDLELRSKLYKAAEANYRKSLAISNDFDRARTGLAVTLSCQGRYQEAAKEWQTILERNPSDKLAQRGLKVAESALANGRVERTR